MGEDTGDFACYEREGHYTRARGIWQETMVCLHRFLVDYDMAMLRALAQSRGVTLSTNRQTEAVDKLSTALLDPLSVRVALAHLSEDGRAALAVLLAAGDKMRVSRFARRFGQVRSIGPGRLQREAPWKKPANASEELLYSGLVFRGFSEDQAGPGEFVFVPEDLVPLLPRSDPEKTPFLVQEVPTPTSHVDGGSALVRDLFKLLVFLQTHDVRTYADGRLGGRDTTALRRQLSDPDERRLELLRHLAGRMGFETREDGALRLVSGPVRRWLLAPLVQQQLSLQEAWRDDPTWFDLCRVPDLDCDADATGRPQVAAWIDPVATRRAILRLLARCPMDAWWSLPSFVAAVKEADPDFQRPDGDYESWYIRDAISGAYLSGFGTWDQVEGRLITDLLTGPLCWLGAVVMGPGDAGPVCRVTTAGLRLMGLSAEEPKPARPSVITVRPDFRVEVAEPVSLYTRFQLERFAVLESLVPCRYRLSVDSIGRAAARGVSVDQVLAFLHQYCGQSVPANVIGQLRLWAGRFGQLVLEEATLLTAKQERVIKELSVLPETRSLIARILSPTSALIRGHDLPRLKRELRKLGYLSPSTADRQDKPDERG